MLTDEAFETDQESVVACPAVMLAGFAEKDPIVGAAGGGGGGGGTDCKSAGLMATATGYTPTRGIVLISVLLPVSITDTVKLYSFVTYARVPSGLIAMQVGMLPTPMFAIRLEEAVSITPTV